MKAILVKATLLFLLSVPIISCENNDASGNTKLSEEYTMRAENYIKQGQFKAAIIEIKNAIKTDPGYLKAYLLYTDILYQQGNHLHAIEVLEGIENKTANVYLSLAKNNLKLGKAKTALELISQAKQSSQYKADTDAILIEAKANIILKRFNEALKLVAQAKEKTSNKTLLSEVEITEAYVHKLSQNSEKLKLSLDKALKLNPNNIDAMIMLSSVYYSEQSLEQAEDLLTKALYSLPSTDTLTLKRLQILKSLTSILMEQGRTSEALVYSKLISEANPNAQKIESTYETAIEALKAGDIQKAEKLLQGLYSEHNLKASGALLGMIKYEQGDYTAADNFFQNTLDPETASEKALAYYAGTQLRLKSPEQALAAIESNIKENSNDTQLLSIYGISLLAAGKIEQAKEVIKSTLELDPGLSRLRIALANIYNSQDERQAALSELKSAAQNEPKNATVQELLLKQYQFMGEKQQHAAYARELTNHESVESKALGAIALLDTDPEFANQVINNAYTNNPTNKLVLNAKVISALNQKDYSSTQKYAKELVAIAPNNTFALTIAAASISKLTNNNDAVQYLIKQGKESADNWAADIVLAQHHSNSGNLQLAVQHAEAALAKSAFNSASTSTAINIYKTAARESFKSGSIKNARKYAIEASQLAPNDTSLLYLLVTIDLADSNITQASQIQKQISELEPNSYYSYLANADIHKINKNAAEAFTNYYNAWKIKPSDKLGKIVWSNITEDNKKLTKSRFIQEWKQTIPKSHEALTIEAIQYQQSGNYPAAKMAYRKSLDKNTNQPIALNNLAWIYFEDSNIKAALDLSEKAFKLAPENPAIIDTYGWLLYKSGDNEKARDLLAKAAKLAPHNKEIQLHLDEVESKK